MVARYLLDLSSCIFLCIYEVWSDSFQTQVSRYLSLLSQSKPLLFTKIPLPFKTSTLSEHPFLGKCSKSHLFFFIHAFHAFCDLIFSFGENFMVFEFLWKSLGWILLIWSYMHMHCILCLYNHVFMHSRLCAWLYNVSAVVWIGFCPWCNFFCT